MLATQGRSMKRPRNILRLKDHVINRNCFWKCAIVVCFILQTVQRSRIVVPVKCFLLWVQLFRGTTAWSAGLIFLEGTNSMQIVSGTFGLQNKKTRGRMRSTNWIDTGGFYTCGVEPQHSIGLVELLERKAMFLCTLNLRKTRGHEIARLDLFKHTQVHIIVAVATFRKEEREACDIFVVPKQIILSSTWNFRKHSHRTHSAMF